LPWTVLALVAAAAFWAPPAAAQVPPAQEPTAQEPEPIEVEDLRGATQGGAAQEGAPQTPPPVQRITFEFPLPAEKGGGTVKGTTGALDLQREDQALLSGGVEVLYQDVELTADRAQIDLVTSVVTATGNVVIVQGPERLTAASAVYDLEADTGSLTDAEAYVSPDYYFTGTEIAKVDADVYTVTDGIFTSCSQEVPTWSFKVARARVRVDGFAKAKGASLRVKNVPVLYVPYILWPVKDERTSGFLVPQPGYSRRLGTSLSVAYYQVLGRSYDTTFELDAYTEGFVGLGNRFRYRPSEHTRGIFEGYAIDDPTTDEVRWRLDWNHETRDLPFGLRGVIDYQDFSDFEFFRDFDRNFNQNTLRFLDSRGYVSGNWGAHSVNILANQRETFINPTRTVTLSKLPEVEYRLRPTRLGKLPLYVQLDSSLDYLDLNRSPTQSSTYLRTDFFPRLTLPLRTVPWLSVSLTAGERLTLYGDSLFTPQEIANQTPEERDDFSGDSLSRTLPFGSAEIIGPSLSRIFDGGGKRFSKLKHVLEPRFTYTFLGDFDEEDQIPLFDEVDNVRSSNVGRVSIINRLLAKPAGENAGSAREILSLELAQEFSFDDTRPLQRGAVETETGTEFLTRSSGPILGLLRYNPGPGLNLKARLRYNTLFDEVESTSLSATYGTGGNLLDLTWFTRTQPATGESTQNQVRLGGSWNILPGKLRVMGGVNYDFELGVLQQQRYILEYVSQCCGLRFEIRDFQAGAFTDTDFRIAISLKNVGTFLDFTGGLSSNGIP
jgi:LPS-assembly protein